MANQVRFGWDDRSEAYRRRLERQGISRTDWEQGADLRKARGHAPKPQPGAAPKDLVEKVVKGEATPKDFRKLERSFRWPRWVPRNLPDNGPTSPDVAAALSLLPPPSRWKSVDFQPRGDGQFWTMTVIPKGRAYPVVIDIPGGGGPGSGARQILEIVTLIGKAPAKKRTAAEELFFEVMGSV